MLAQLDEALTILRKRFAESTAGSGRLVVVTGALASGKTSLQHDFLNYAQQSGALTLSATGAPDEHTLNTGIVDQLLKSAELSSEITDRVSRIIAPDDSGHRGEDTATWSTEPTGIRAIRDVCGVFLELARERPVVISVDDLQFVDAWSLQFLKQLRRRIRSTRLLIVLSQWNWPHTKFLRLHAGLTSNPHHHVQLAPMSAQAIAEHIRDAFGDVPGDDLAIRIHRLSAGNPMLVRALIEDYQAGERTGQPVVGEAFFQAVLACLHRWDSSLLEVARALAVLGRHGTTVLIARLAGISSDTVDEVLDVLTAAGLLADGWFRHPVAAAAALDGLAPERREQLQLLAADLKYQHALAVRDVAAHLVSAGKVPAPWSISVLRETAEQAVLEDDVNFATQCLELALSASTDGEERMALVMALARITWRVNPSATSAYLATLREALLDGTLGRRDSVTLARHSLWNGDRETSSKALDALTCSSDPADAQTRAEVRLAYQWHYGPTRADHQGPAADPPAGADPWTHTASTLSKVWTHGGGEAATACAERVLQSCRLGDTTLEALTTAIMALVSGNLSERAEWWCAKLFKEAERHGARTWQAMLGGVWSGIVLRRGDVNGAVERAHASLTLLRAQSWGVSISYPLTTLLSAHTASGSYEAAAETLRYPVPGAMFSTVGGLRYLRARGRYYLATDRALAAISDFERCQRLMREWDADLAVLVPWRIDLAEAYASLGDTAAARELALAQLERPEAVDAYTRGASLRVLAHLSEVDGRRALLHQAGEQFRRSGDQLELTRTLAELNRIPPQGRPEFSPSTVPFTPRTIEIPHQKTSVQKKAGLPGATGANEIRLAGTGYAAPPALSDAERRVAQLAALGQTNREIGSNLFITVSTVEQHLTRVYRKLGVRGRSDLPTQLGLAT